MQDACPRSKDVVDGSGVERELVWNVEFQTLHFFRFRETKKKQQGKSAGW
jgi:hypothetical protein